MKEEENPQTDGAILVCTNYPSPSFCQSGVDGLPDVLMTNYRDKRRQGSYLRIGTLFPHAVKDFGDRPLNWTLAIATCCFSFNRRAGLSSKRGWIPAVFNWMVILNPSRSIWVNCSYERKSAVDFGAGYLAP